jgi:GT2 family glycosyltransferase
LQACLASIVQAIQFAHDLRCEIVVIDNGSSDDTAGWASQYLAQSGVSFRVEREDRPGLAAARNAAIRHSAGRVLVFTDDDCRLTADYIRATHRHHAADAAPVMRGGRVELGDARDLAFTVITDPRGRRYEPTERTQILGGFILGCNMTAPRALLDAVGPFDERFGVGAPFRAAEDTDYLYRVHMAGFGIEYAPDMVIEHYHGRRSVDDLRRVIDYYNEGEGAIYAKYLFGPRAFFRQLRWDVRDALAETILRRPVRDVFGVRKLHKLKSTTVGFWRYLSYPLARHGLGS